MLYRGSEIMREVAWVIFDEIHYMRDKERGCCMGRSNNPPSAYRALSLSLCNHTKRDAIL